jgi:hypothetical protein
MVFSRFSHLFFHTQVCQWPVNPPEPLSMTVQ